MPEKIMVSVVVPVYNQEAYLDKSIPSILEQKYKDIEVVLVNDGSTDNSAAILNKYGEKDARVKIISKENGGLVSASIAGVRNSSGDYICFLDPDDYYGPNYISNFVSEINDDVDLIAAGFYQDNCGHHDPVF